MADLQQHLADRGAEFWARRSQDLIGLIDPGGLVHEANDRLAALIGGRLPADFAGLLAEADRPRLRDLLAATADPDPQTVVLAIDPAGSGAALAHACWIAQTAGDRALLIAEPLPDTAAPGGVDVATLARELHQAQAELAIIRRSLDETLRQVEQLARTDTLTGLANHRVVLARLEDEIVRAGRHGRPLSILLIDLDRFKYVNDTHGHQVGDAVLRQTADTLAGVIRRSDTLGRYGGEEFLAVLPETDLAAARLLAERLRRHVEAAHYAVADRVALAITISIGVAAFTPGTDTPEGLIARADRALREAKEAGRNRVGVDGGD